MRVRSFLLLGCFVALGCGGSSTETPSTVTGDTGTTPTTDTSTTPTTDSTAPPTDTGTTPTTDSTIPPTDTGGGGTGDAAGIKCGAVTCGAGEVCCASAADGGGSLACVKGSCPDGGATISCDGPEDCTGGEICCAQADIEGTIPACTFKSGEASCKKECKSNIPFSCPGKATVRPCHKAADCTESGYSNCCLFEGGGGSGQFCTPTAVKSFAKSCDPA